jgi:hypothetical protein
MLFYPVDDKKTLKQQYPELNSVQEFKDLSQQDEMLVWLYSCQSSPISDIKDPYLRIQKACEMMSEKNKIKDVDRSKYLSLQFPEKIKAAMEVMRKFNPEIRTRAKIAVDQMFNNLMAIASININDFMFKTDENAVRVLDATAINNYTTAMQKVRDELPSIIKMQEDGFGISSSVSVDLASGKSPHQIFMERQKNK